jgi:16S rRNA (adenine1518-N6/adenine1519-N6)-dimethyltransferase
VARLTVRREPAFAVPPAFARTVSAAFSARRKTLRNALRSLVDVDAIVAAGIDPQLRPEVLSPAEFAKLAAQVPDDSSN